MTKQAPTFAVLRAIVDKMGIRHGELSDLLDDVLDRARINADETCHTEKAAPLSDWDRIAYASVQDILSQSHTDSKVVTWFEQHGVTF